MYLKWFFNYQTTSPRNAKHIVKKENRIPLLKILLLKNWLNFSSNISPITTIIITRCHLASSYAKLFSKFFKNVLSMDEWITKMWYILIQWNIIQPQWGKKFWHMLQLDEPWKHYAKWNKLDTIIQILNDSSYMRYLE